MLLGRNCRKQDVKEALQLAASCDHPDAQWLTEIFAGKNVQTKHEAHAVFLEQGENDARSLCFSEMIFSPPDNVSRLRRSAQLGYAFAQACMACITRGEERFLFASQAALQGERDGFNILGGKENSLVAAKLNSVWAMGVYGSYLDDLDPQRWYWWGLAASRGDNGNFMANFSKQVDPPVVFMIGRALKGNIDMEKREIFGINACFDSRIGPAERAVEFFIDQCDAARKAINMWTRIALRVGNSKLNKDIRKKVGMLIWEARDLAEYRKARK